MNTWEGCREVAAVCVSLRMQPEQHSFLTIFLYFVYATPLPAAYPHLLHVLNAALIWTKRASCWLTTIDIEPCYSCQIHGKHRYFVFVVVVVVAAASILHPLHSLPFLLSFPICLFAHIGCTFFPHSNSTLGIFSLFFFCPRASVCWLISLLGPRKWQSFAATATVRF